MKKGIIITILFLIANSFWACEPDDICESGTPTTPRLIIEFYDNASPSTKKNVTDLKVIANGQPNGIVFNTTTDDSKYRFTGSKLSLPLKTDTDQTKYSLILNDGNPITTLIDEDQITINYIRKNEYISRACGYKTLFTLDPTSGVVRTISAPNWIKEIAIQQYNIVNENEIHVKIFF
jgi:hypothetical protein